MGDIVVNGINFLALVFGMVEFSKKRSKRGEYERATSNQC